ncbi:MAG TPA: hypothetical protein PKK23_08475 [Nitrospirales bacterium]|nr:hypothetical protein [Nitrospiraceae bacterium]HNP29064.1 hypothetical protein [Nitrospirales bacterium]
MLGAIGEVAGWRSVLLVGGVLIVLLGIPTPSQAGEESELAKQTQNPVGDLISIPFQNNMNVGLESNHRTQSVLNIQPVIPLNLTPDCNLITRTILPIIKQPDLPTASDDTWGNRRPQYISVPFPDQKERVDLGRRTGFAIPHRHG